MVLKRGAGRLQIKPIGPGDEHGYDHLLLYGKTSLIGSFSVGILHIWYNRGPTQSVCVADCYFIVNVLDLLFASPIAIYR